jgi:hypothetical protein
MLDKFSGRIGQNLGDKLTAAIATPAFIFLCGCSTILIEHLGWKVTSDWFLSLSDTFKILCFFGIFILVNISTSLIKNIDLFLLRLWQGYYWIPILRSFGVRWQFFWFERDKKRLIDLAKKNTNNQLSREEQLGYSKLDYKARHFPLREERFMPTELGNVISAAMSYPNDRYGLSVNVCWSNLWFILPDTIKQDLIEAEGNLRTKFQVLLWSLLFTIGAFWSWWAAPLGIIIALVAYRGVVSAALVYCDLIKASFDNHRFELYAKLHLPMPKHPEEEIKTGTQLTKYLWRGSDDAVPKFIHSDFKDNNSEIQSE